MAIQNASPTLSSAAAFGAGAIEDSDTAYSSWWCSNGLYKTLTGSGAGTLNGTQLFLSSANPRLELALVGCPQKAAVCGSPTSVLTALSSGTAATAI